MLNYSKFHFVLIAGLVIIGCSNSTERESVEANIGKVIIVKSKIFADEKFHYGAFKINDVFGPKKHTDGGYYSFIAYQWMLEGEGSNQSGEAKISDIESITFGKSASGIIEVGWNYASLESVYLHHSILTQSDGPDFCITNLNDFPKSKLADVDCNYHISKKLEL
jgi:hypothetical protein